VRPVDRYNCEETFRRFDDYLDRELTPEEMELVREHLDFCARCARELAFEESVLRQVRGKVRRISLPPNLMDRISRTLSDTTPADE
jgi:mycothiol system anti-sigma-R factor